MPHAYGFEQTTAVHHIACAGSNMRGQYIPFYERQDFLCILCTFFTFFMQTSCELQYNGAGSGSESINVALIVEDYPKSAVTIGGSTFSTTDRLSFISLQFTIRGKLNCWFHT